MNEKNLAEFIHHLSEKVESTDNKSEITLFEYVSSFLNPELSILLKIDKQARTFSIHKYFSTCTSSNIAKLNNFHFTSYAALQILASRTIHYWKNLSDILPSTQLFKDINDEIGINTVIGFAFFFDAENNAYAFVFAFNNPPVLSDYILSVIYVVSKLYLKQNILFKKIELSDILYNQLFLQNPIFPIAVLENRSIVLCSHAFLQLLGYNDTAFVMKKTLSELSPLTQPDNNFSVSAENKLFEQLQSQHSFIFRWSFNTANQQTLFTYCFIQKISDPEKDRYFLFVQNITHLQKIKKQFNYIRNQLTTIYNTIPAGVGIVQNRTIIEVNDYFLKLTGYSRDELLNKNVLLLYANPEEFESIGTAVYERSIQDGYAQVTLQLKRKDGQTIWCLITISPLFPEIPEKGFVVTALDITEQKRNEIHLKQTLKKIEEIYNAVPVGIIEVRDRIILQVNSSLCQMLGYEQHELIGAKTRKLYVSNRDYLNAGNFIYSSLSSNQFCTYQTTFRKKTGETVEVVLNVKRSEAHNDTNRYIATVQNVTQLKIIEQQLKNIEKQHQIIINNIQDTICQLDLDMNVTYASPSIYFLTGFQPNEIIGRSFQHLFSDDNWNRLQFFMKQIIASRRNILISRNTIETTIRTKYNTQKFVEITSTLLLNEHNKPSGVIITARDITDRKQHQIYQQKIFQLQSEIARLIIEAGTMNSMTELIQRTSLFITQMLEHIPLACYEYNTSLKQLFLINSNTTDAEYLQDKHQLPQKIPVNHLLLRKATTRKIIALDPLEIKISFEKLTKHFHEQQIFATSIFLFDTPKILILLFPLQPLTEADKQLINLLTAQLSQIMTRRLAEIQLAQHEKMFRTFLDSSNEFAYVKNLQFKYVYVNKIFEKLFSHQKMIGKTDYCIFPKKVASTIRKNEQIAINTDTHAQTIIRNLDKTYILRNFPIITEQGDTYIGGVMIDVSEDNYKKAEREFLFLLQQSKYSFQTLHHFFQRLLQFLREYYYVQCLSYWEHNPSDHTLCLRYTSDSKKIITIASSEHKLNENEWKQFIPLSFGQIQSYAFSKIPDKEVSFVLKLLNLNERSLSNDITSHQICILSFNIQKNLVGFLIVLFKPFREHAHRQLINLLHQVKIIIEKNLSEHLIAEQEKLKSTIVSQISEVLLIMTPDCKILFANDKAHELFGSKLSDIKFPDLFQIFPDAACHQIQEVLPQVFSHKTTHHFEIELFDANNHRRYFQVSLSPIFFDNKPAALVTLFDTTQQKLHSIQLLETGLKAQEEERNRISTELHDGLSAHLASAKMLLSVLKNQVHQEHHTIIKNIQEIIDYSAATVQEIIRNITPQILHNFGLVRAIESYAKKYKEAGITVEIHNNLKKRLDELTEIHLYRILQELLNNSIRHGKCQNITIEFIERYDVYSIKFTHDGQTFNFERALKMSQGFGLKNIMQRIHLLNGNFEYVENKAGGMIYIITIARQNRASNHHERNESTDVNKGKS